MIMNYYLYINIIPINNKFNKILTLRALRSTGYAELKKN